MNHCLSNIGLSSKSLNLAPEQIKQGERTTKTCSVECYCKKARVKLVITLSREGPNSQFLIRIQKQDLEPYTLYLDQVLDNQFKRVAPKLADSIHEISLPIDEIIRLTK